MCGTDIETKYPCPKAEENICKIVLCEKSIECHFEGTGYRLILWVENGLPSQAG